MKFRHPEPLLTDAEEQRATDELKGIIRDSAIRPPVPPADTYWSNLLVRTNRRIDEVTSGRGISMSWAARVAIPGVVAIISFFVGLHYYVEPVSERTRNSLAAVVASLPESAFDTLVTEPEKVGVSLPAEEIDEDVLTPSRDQISEYFISTGTLSSVVDVMTDDQVAEVLVSMGLDKTNL